MKTFTVNATRSGKWWALEVPEVPGVFSQARRLDQAGDMARDAIATMLDIDPDSFEVAVSPTLPADVRAILDSIQRTRDDLAEAQRAVAVALQRAVTTLTRDGGLSMRDAGKVMGISHQRIAQILEENERLGRDIGDFGGGEMGGPAFPQAPPTGPHGRDDAPVEADAR